ncbi:MAG: ABC transporter substrate-binding protein [Nitrososphaerales archaeon]|nr:ABC transporter substrate-binding protein [Nitrososphaerales archaeon]
MRSSTIEETATGAVLAFIGFMLIFSAFPAPVAAQGTSTLFSITVVAPTSNPLRRQWAAIIVNNYQSVGIDAKLIYVSFGTMASLSFACSASNCGKLYSQGGFDEIFVGFGGGTPLPDFGTQNVVTYRSATPADLAPIGGNFNFYKNSTYNALALQYSSDFNATDRSVLAQKMVRIVGQDRPDLVIYYPVDTYGLANYISPWGNKNPESSATNTNDFQHWQLTGGQTVLNIAQTGDFQSVNQIDTAASNIYYATYLYHPVSAALEELDGRSLNYFNALATSITSSSDHLTWTVAFRAHNFQDGVPVTADDYVFSTLAGLRNDVGYVGEGTLQGLLGLNVQLTFLNGTSDYVTNGTYSHGTAPAGFTANSVWTAVTPTSFKFTLPTTYLFTDPVLTGGSAVPMHIFEQYKASTWATSFLSTLQNTPTKVTWNAARYGGNGSYAYVYGPIGDGAYLYRGWDNVAQTGTLVKWSGYWNATGLQNLGQFNIQTIHATHIINKDQALGAFNTGTINFLDSNYVLNPQDFAVLQANSGYATQRSSPSAGWQETSLNMVSPVWGTGTATPLGQQTPAKAAFAARAVRNAMSHLIPRQYIITNLLQGIGSIGVTQFCTCFAFAYPKDVQPDTFDPTLAKSLLAQAGYSTGVSAGGGGVINIPAPPTISTTCVSTSGGGGGASSTTVNVPSFILGNTLSSTGTFAVVPTKGTGSGGFYAVLLQSTTGTLTKQGNLANATAVALTTTTDGGYYNLVYTPTVTGKIWYQVQFTGVPLSGPIGTVTVSSPSLPLGYIPPAAPSNGNPVRNITASQFSQITPLNVGSLGDVFTALTTSINNGLASVSSSTAASINAALCTFGTQTNGALSSLKNSTQTALNGLQSSSASKTDLQNAQTTLGNQITTVNNSVSSLSTVSYAALAVAIVLGLIAIALSMRKPKA